MDNKTENEYGVDLAIMTFGINCNGHINKVLPFVSRFVLGLVILLLRKNLMNYAELKSIINFTLND